MYCNNTFHNSGHIACNPAQLGYHGMSVSNSSICGASFSTLATENAVVCYNGNDVGAIAVYCCTDCSYNQLRGQVTMVQTCGRDGQWDGNIPHCAHCKCNSNFL